MAPGAGGVFWRKAGARWGALVSGGGKEGEAGKDWWGERWRRSEDGAVSGVRKKEGWDMGIGIAGHERGASCDARIEAVREREREPRTDALGSGTRKGEVVALMPLLPPPPPPVSTSKPALPDPNAEPKAEADPNPLNPPILRANTDPCRASDIPSASALAQTRQQITARLRCEQKHYDVAITSSEDSEQESQSQSTRARGLRRFNTLIGKERKRGRRGILTKASARDLMEGFAWRSVEGLGRGEEGGASDGKGRSASAEVLGLEGRGGRTSTEREQGEKNDA